MDVKLKQRLIGAVIITSLAIIILPLVLDGTEAERQRVMAEIPSPPRIELETITYNDIAQKMEQMQRASEARLPQEIVDETDYSQGEDFQLDKNLLPVSWSLQVGSFNVENNATGLREKLRRANFRSYILHSRANDEDLYRVLIGPMVSKDELNKMGEQIESLFKLKGQIVRYAISEDAGQLGG